MLGFLLQTVESSRKDLVLNSKAAGEAKAQQFALALSVGVIVFACIAASQPVFAHATQTLSSTIAPQTDPNKGPSELNHHIAGWSLIGVGLLAFSSVLSPSLGRHRFLWPALFVLAGFYLALWSDGEIWPRGNLNWLWLLGHDAEARQHKIYSVLLVAIGAIEYVRIRGSLARFWRVLAFPLLAVIGAGMLLVHDHTGGSGARLHEAQFYLVNPALDVDGRPRKANPAMDHADITPEQRHPMQGSASDAMNALPMNHSAMRMDHSEMTTNVPAGNSLSTSPHHAMTTSMLRVEHEHIWFLIVGVAIGLFKFISDGEFFRNRIVPCIWPTCTVLLGFMLVFYRE
jgi:hypothetical protein